MEEMILEKDLLAISKKNVEAYLASHDVKYCTEDAVYTHLNTGDQYKGRDEIAGMLHYIYHVAFDARADIKNVIVTEDKAMFEADFIGKHIGEFGGLQPTNREVNVPVTVVYDLEDGFIKKARIYMLLDVMMKQLTE